MLALSIPKIGNERQNVVAELISEEEHSIVATTSVLAEDLLLPSSLILSNAMVTVSDVDIESGSQFTAGASLSADVFETPGATSDHGAVFAAQTPKPISTGAASISLAENNGSVPALLQRIGYCESRNRQFDSYGNVIRGRVNRNDIGKYQINETIWGSEARRLGHDIYTEAGNTAMALYIFNLLGSRPWYPSESCWGASV